MAIPSTIHHEGILLGSNAVGGPSSNLMELFNTHFIGTYGGSKAARPTLVGLTEQAPMNIPLESIVKVRMLGAKARGGSITLMLTSAAGSAQKVTLGSEGLLLWSNTNYGDELTAIAAFGTGDLEYVIAGDVA
jgi:hypothetical protein